VPVEQQRLPAAVAAQPRRQLRAAREADALHRQRMARDVGGVGLPEVDLGAVRAEALGEQGLERGLVARRIVGPRPARGVERDQPAGERDQVVALRGHAADQGLLVAVQRGRVQRANGHRREAYRRPARPLNG
jgi:hypothetical protein